MSCSQCNGSGEESLLGGPCRYCPPQRSTGFWLPIGLAVALVVGAVILLAVRS